MTSTPPRKSPPRKTTVSTPAVVQTKTAVRGEAAAPKKRVAAVAADAGSPKPATLPMSAKAVATPVTVETKVAARKEAAPASEAPTVATTNAVSASAAEPKGKPPVRMHAAPRVLLPHERHHLVEVAAFYIAERRGFQGGSHHDDWLQAEREVDAMIAAGKFGS